METPKPSRWRSAAFALSGLLLIVYAIVDLLLFPDLPAWMPTLALAAFMGLQLGFVGLYIRQVREAGILGPPGFLVAFSGSALFAGLAFFESFTPPSLVAAAPDLPYLTARLLFLAGSALFGAATLRAGVFPKSVGIALILGVLIAGLNGESEPPLLSPPLFVIFYGVGLVWASYVIWKAR